MPHLIALILSLGFAWSLAVPLLAQAPLDREVAGVVTNAATRAPVAGAALTVGEQRTLSDADGRFSLRAPADRLVVEVTAIGYFPFSTVLDLRDRDAVGAEFSLTPDAPFTSSVEVVGGPPPTAAPAAVEVTPAQVLRTPGALDNIFRTLQTLPGVSATDEFGSRIAVRGGAPDQNLTMMDGVEIHDPYRLFGLTSAFNPETIQRFELATGGFSVKYGDRLSSLLLVENREGTRRKPLAGSASLSITDANVVFEGRLPREANGSWLVSARRTYYDLVASRVTDQDYPRFADVQAKGVWEPAPGRTLSFFGLRSRQAAALEIDDDSAQGQFNDDTSNDLASMRFDTSIGQTAQSHTIVAYSNSASRFGVAAAFENRSQRSNAPDDEAIDIANVIFDRTLDVRDISIRQELAWAKGAHVVEAGGEFHRLSTELAYDIRGDRNPSAANGSSQQGGAGLPDSLVSARLATRGGLWLLDRWQVAPAVSLEAGIRVDRSGVARDTQVSPRLLASWALAPQTRLRAAIGRYTQGPGYEKLVQSDYVLDLTGVAPGDLRSEQAVQVSAGLEREFARTATVRVEGYYKRSSRLLIGRLEPEGERLARISEYDFPPSLADSIPTEAIITTVPTNDGRGRAYGVDVFVSRTSAPVNARVGGWVSYTWGRAERDAYGRRYPFEYDRRHAFAAVASYRLSPRWELATTTRVASGFPRTPPIGLRVGSVQDLVDSDGDGKRNERLPATDPVGRLAYAVDYGGINNLNTARLPIFARVDFRATWRPRGAAGRWEFYAEVINLLNRENAGSLEAELEFNPNGDQPRIVEKRDQSIPRLPTIGLRFRF